MVKNRKIHRPSKSMPRVFLPSPPPTPHLSHPLRAALPPPYIHSTHTYIHISNQKKNKATLHLKACKSETKKYTQIVEILLLLLNSIPRFLLFSSYLGHSGKRFHLFSTIFVALHFESFFV